MHASKTRLLALSATLASLLAAPSTAQTLGEWGFEEGSFFNRFGPALPTVVDTSPLANDGYRPDTGRRLSYSTDAASGTFSMNFNDPADTRPYPGVVVVPTTPSLEPAMGWIEAQIKIDHFQHAVLVQKSTFQFHNREPGGPPIFTINGEPRIVGRTVYELGIQPDGRVRAFIADDSLVATSGNGGGPWTFVTSQHLLNLNEWNHVAMEWDGTQLAVYVNGQLSATTSYASMPGHGLSYRAEGIDPTYGPVQLDVALSGSGPNSFVGLMDDVRIATCKPCPNIPVRHAVIGN